VRSQDKKTKSKKPTKQTTEPNPVGRPTDYKPEYCKQLIAWMKKPRSYESFGSVIGVARETLYLWEKKHPEFMHAKRLGRLACQASCEALLIAQSTGQIKGGSQSSLIFFMKNTTSFRDEPVSTEDSYDDMEFNE
jgi:hypothetical protein